jgi:hypothetical protein
MMTGKIDQNDKPARPSVEYWQRSWTKSMGRAMLLVGVLIGVPAASVTYFIFGVPKGLELGSWPADFVILTFIYSMTFVFIGMLASLFAPRARVGGRRVLVYPSQQYPEPRGFKYYALSGLVGALLVTVISYAHVVDDAARLGAPATQLLKFVAGIAVAYFLWFLPLALLAATMDKRYLRSLALSGKNEGAQP